MVLPPHGEPRFEIDGHEVFASRPTRISVYHPVARAPCRSFDDAIVHAAAESFRLFSEVVKKWGLAPAIPSKTQEISILAGACTHFFTTSQPKGMLICTNVEQECMASMQTQHRPDEECHGRNPPALRSPTGSRSARSACSCSPQLLDTKPIPSLSACASLSESGPPNTALPQPESRNRHVSC